MQAFARRWKSVTAAGFDVHLSFLCGIHERFASRGNAEWCKDEDYLLNGGTHKTACVLTSGDEEANSSLMGGESFLISRWVPPGVQSRLIIVKSSDRSYVKSTSPASQSFQIGYATEIWPAEFGI